MTVWRSPVLVSLQLPVHPLSDTPPYSACPLTGNRTIITHHEEQEQQGEPVHEKEPHLGFAEIPPFPRRGVMKL